MYIIEVRSDIINFFEKWCKKYRLSLNYLSGRDTYFLHLEGRALITFTTPQFYQVPKMARARQILPLIKKGLAQNLGEASMYEQIFMNRHLGKRLINGRI